MLRVGANAYWLAILLALSPVEGVTADIHAVAGAIRYEATLPADSAVGYPLPLAAHWNTGESGSGFGPEYQMAMIEKGHYLLPWFHLPPPTSAPLNYLYYRDVFKQASELNLPISFVSTQWESVLTDSPHFFSLKPEDNPNVVDTAGQTQKKVSPFGPLPAWQEAGKMWTSRDLVGQLQSWDPHPPLVLFVSNNEHAKLSWRDVRESGRFQAMYPEAVADVQKKRLVGNDWVERYRALQQGMRDGLTQDAWKKKALFIGYDAFGTRAFGRWAGWVDYSLHIPGRIEPWPLAWDGASLSYYVYNWSSGTDFSLMSPQVEAMNWVFMQAEARNLNPDFWIEMSTWDGYEPTKLSDKRKYYAILGQEFNPARYAGYVQFGMWLLRPRVVREFRNHLAVLSQDETYFLSVVNAVDRVHNHTVLRKFWRKGRLVANPGYEHPYQVDIPSEYENVHRWFLLDTDLDPQRPWTLNTTIPVFSLALMLGEKPNREWLVYGHAPLGDQSGVRIVVPDCATIEADISPRGAFFHVIEKNGSISIAPLDI